MEGDDIAVSLVDVLGHALAQCWMCYHVRMEIVNFPQSGFQQVGASGECPHCNVRSYFRPVTTAYFEQRPRGDEQYICNAAQCEACKRFVLVVGVRLPVVGEQLFRMQACYPLGKPNDSVDPEVPARIAEDFREALRCQWVEARRATVSMCRRALQASAIEQGVDPQKRLVDQVDELAARGIITKPLQERAHEIRLVGNVGAHPDEDGLADVTAEDAADIVEFTRDYFHHIYVMQAKLTARRSRQKQAAGAPVASSSAPGKS